MRVFVCSLLVTCVLGARLDNTYLPPTSARTAGGSGSFLSTPAFGGHSSPSSSLFRSSGSSFTSGHGASGQTFGATVGQYGGGAGQYSGAAGQYSGAAGQYSGATSYSTGPQFRILKLDSQNPGDGSYRFEYETENQISQQEAGEVRNAGTEHAASSVRGTYTYTAPDGQHITVNYVADENGFRPEGAHLPTPPPIPEEIQKSLAINAASSSSNNGNYYGSSGQSDSGAYDAVEISAARSSSSGSASRQYLAPAIARASQGAGGYRY